jgi:hypothetical protein
LLSVRAVHHLKLKSQPALLQQVFAVQGDNWLRLASPINAGVAAMLLRLYLQQVEPAFAPPPAAAAAAPVPVSGVAFQRRAHAGACSKHAGKTRGSAGAAGRRRSSRRLARAAATVAPQPLPLRPQ